MNKKIIFKLKHKIVRSGNYGKNTIVHTNKRAEQEKETLVLLGNSHYR